MMRTNVATKTALTAGLALLLSSAAQGSTVLYVDAGAPAGGDGLSWETCARFLQDVLAYAADPANEVVEIRVAQGVYTPDRSEAVPGGTGDRTMTFQLVNGVALLGGYAGPGVGVDPDTRDIVLYPTILSGDLLGNDLPDFVNNDENCLHVVTAGGTGAGTLLDGFTITAGNADGEPATSSDVGAGIFNGGGSPRVAACLITDNFAEGAGAGMINMFGASPRVSACTFSGNVVSQTATPSAGGAVINYAGANGRFTDCVFTGNTAREGGAVLNQDASPRFEGCLFDDNHASWGGGMDNYLNGNATVIDCIFTNNTAVIGTDGFGGYGGGLDGVSCTLDVRACVFDHNSAERSGGGMFSSASLTTVIDCEFTSNDVAYPSGPQAGGGMTSGNSNFTTVIRSLFQGNTAGLQGGGVRNATDSTLFMYDCRVLDNQGPYGGGINNFTGSTSVFINCLIAGNQAPLTPPGSEFAGGFGGGLYTTYGAVAELINCTVADNTADDTGGGMRTDDSVSSLTALTNSIVWGNTPDQINNDTGGVTTAEYSDIEDGYPGAGNINEDPLFIDPDNGDYRLGAGSPCIDAADNAAVPPDSEDLDGDGDVLEPVPYDLDGNPRFVDDPNTPDTGNPDGVNPLVDMGAYEYQGSPCPWDLDGSGTVDTVDFLDLLSQWGQPGPADFDGSGSVDTPDFLALLANWGPCP